MRIRSLLLGTAAALVAVSGARAADAVMMPEPEPVEYVRVCDAFGSGFFYIPGTETCLRLSGYVRYKIGTTNDDGVNDTPNFNGYVDDAWNKETRARLNVDARSDTEWGLLRGYMRFQGTWGDRSDGDAVVDQAWLSLGGFLAGYTDTAWKDVHVGGVYTGGSHSDGELYVGDQQRHVVQYNFGGDSGIFATASLEDDEGEGEGYMPNVVGVVGYAAGWGGVWGRIGYDDARGDPLDPDAHGFAASIGLQLNMPNSPDSSLRLIGYYADSDNEYGTYSAYGSVAGGFGNAEFAVLASYYHQFTETFGASIGGEYFNDFYEPFSDVGTGIDGYIAEVSLVWEPVENFEVRTEVTYDKIDTLDGSVSGFLWFQRSF